MAKSPTNILMDFEQAALNSVQEVYPNVELKRCSYHFSSNVWKHIQNLAVDNKNFVLWLHIFSALAFVSSQDVIRYLELLIEEIHNNFNNECDNLIDCFQNTYIGETIFCFILCLCNRLRNPIFKSGCYN